jgi:hypothetical protein
MSITINEFDVVPAPGPKGATPPNPPPPPAERVTPASFQEDVERAQRVCAERCARLEAD